MSIPYLISLVGCDDTTNMVMWFTQEEYDLIKEIENLSKKMSTYSCMPVLKLEPLDYVKHKFQIEDMKEIINKPKDHVF